MFKRSLLAVVATFALLVPSAQAAQITFDLTGSNSLASFFDVLSDVGGYNAHITGVNTGGAASVYRTGAGMGVYSGGQDDPQIDGSGADETLVLQLSSALQLVSATFGAVGSDDDFALTVNNVYQGSADIPNSNTYVFGGTYIASLFGFTVASSNDDYYLTSVTFNETRSNEVPEPATMLLLGTGALGAAVKRRRLRAAA